VNHRAVAALLAGIESAVAAGSPRRADAVRGQRRALVNRD